MTETNKIRYYRRLYEISINDLAEETGISKCSLRKYEQFPNFEMKVSTLVKIKNGINSLVDKKRNEQDAGNLNLYLKKIGIGQLIGEMIQNGNDAYVINQIPGHFTSVTTTTSKEKEIENEK